MTAPAVIENLNPGEVFVFGANAHGFHNGGAARTAFEKFGAEWGVGDGLTGSAYAIDTMSGLEVLSGAVQRFIGFATKHPDLRFLVTEVGCGIAGFTPEVVAPFFAGAPKNVELPARFEAVL